MKAVFLLATVSMITTKSGFFPVSMATIIWETNPSFTIMQLINPNYLSKKGVK